MHWVSNFGWRGDDVYILFTGSRLYLRKMVREKALEGGVFFLNFKAVLIAWVGHFPNVLLPHVDWPDENIRIFSDTNIKIYSTNSVETKWRYIIYCSLTNFMPLAVFYTPLKHQKTRVLWCVYGVQKDTRGMKWVKSLSHGFLPKIK